jgi:arginase
VGGRADDVCVNAAGWFLLGALWDCSGTHRGEQAAPGALRAAGLSGLVSRDLGDVPTNIDSTRRDQYTGVLALPETLRSAHALADSLTAALHDHPERRPLVVGGDCSILLGILPALRRSIGHVGLWFTDGHPDYMDGLGSETGETADMDLAVLTGDGAAPLVMLAGEPPMLSVSDTVLLGHRTQDLDAGALIELGRLPAGLRRIDAATLTRDPIAAGQRAAPGWPAQVEAHGYTSTWMSWSRPRCRPSPTCSQAARSGNCCPPR